MSASYDMIGRPTFYTPITENPIVDQEQENTGPEVTRYDNTTWGVGVHGSRPDNCLLIDTCEKAIQYAKEHKYQTIVKRPAGHTYYFRDPITYTRSRTYEQILNTQQEHIDATTWVLKYR